MSKFVMKPLLITRWGRAWLGMLLVTLLRLLGLGLSPAQLLVLHFQLDLMHLQLVDHCPRIGS